MRHCSILCFVLILRLTQVNSARVSGGGRGVCKDDLGLYEKREWIAAETKTTTTTTTTTTRTGEGHEMNERNKEMRKSIRRRKRKWKKEEAREKGMERRTKHGLEDV